MHPNALNVYEDGGSTFDWPVGRIKYGNCLLESANESNTYLRKLP